MSRRAPATRPAPRDASSPSRVEGEEGYALLVALVALVALSTLAAAGSLVSWSESRISDNHLSSVRARQVARSGLSAYLGSRVSAAVGDTFAYGSDTAFVSAERLLFVTADSSETLHRVTARGLRTRAAPRSDAERTVSTVVITVEGDSVSVTPQAALTSAGTVHGGGSGEIRIVGWDACQGSETRDVAGVRVPAGADSVSYAGIDGNPPVVDTGTAVAVLRETGVDAAVWSALKNGSAGPPDYTVSSDSWPTEFSDWPMILVPGSDTLTGRNTGQGLIVVQGDLTVQPQFEWKGLILAGGGLVAEGSYLKNAGNLIAGLNFLLGDAPRDTRLGNRTKKFEHHSCNVASALEGVDVVSRTLAEEPGTWYETM